jgi:hypothetical protein
LAGADTTICLNWASCNSCVVPIIPTNQSLENITIFSESGACYNATQTITVAGNNTYFTVEAFGEATMIAGQNIVMLPGTTVASGGYLHGYITSNDQYCLVPVASPAKSAENKGDKPAAANEFTLKLFPNPATAEVVLDLQGIADGTQANLEMLGMRGDVIRTGSFSENGKHLLSLYNLPAGVYCIRMISGNQVITKMLLKK